MIQSSRKAWPLKAYKMVPNKNMSSCWSKIKKFDDVSPSTTIDGIRLKLISTADLHQNHTVGFKEVCKRI